MSNGNLKPSQESFTQVYGQSNIPKSNAPVATTSAKRSSLAITFWGYLVLGSLGWVLVYLIAGFLFLVLPDEPNGAMAGTILLVISAFFYLWGFVFSGLSLGAALRYKGRPLWKWLTCIFCIVYILALMAMLIILVHVMTIT